jgi:hypothetical protein
MPHATHTLSHGPFAQISCDVTGEKNPSVSGAGLASTQFVSYALAVSDLALAYYYTENEAYLARAATLTRAFFIEPGTRMNPHLSFGQSWPGVWFKALHEATWRNRLAVRIRLRRGPASCKE